MAISSAPLARLPEVALGCGGIEKYQPVSCFNLAGTRGVQVLYPGCTCASRQSDFFCYCWLLLLAVDAARFVDDSQCQARFLF